MPFRRQLHPEFVYREELVCPVLLEERTLRLAQFWCFSFCWSSYPAVSFAKLDRMYTKSRPRPDMAVRDGFFMLCLRFLRLDTGGMILK